MCWKQSNCIKQGPKKEPMLVGTYIRGTVLYVHYGSYHDAVRVILLMVVIRYCTLGTKSIRNHYQISSVSLNKYTTHFFSLAALNALQTVIISLQIRRQILSGHFLWTKMINFLGWEWSTRPWKMQKRWLVLHSLSGQLLIYF